MHRVRVRNRASVGATVARRAYSPAPYLCMRIDATRLFGAEIVLGNRCIIALWWRHAREPAAGLQAAGARDGSFIARFIASFASTTK
ncbi:hypothetical protein EVAR_91814_1 [Eumeta japonica]|uniref:Uncharacterized protein n=1 Tax=Eumeta variegata TaxID=151549 RepID=A0A4C1TBA2_EUMVA|nr:hypothetical protein EVAR_91814_1 [Eumeta japonica]